MKKFGAENFDNVAYFNFERNPALSRVFENDISPSALVPKLSIMGDVSIAPGKTLLIFDEVQECKRCLTSLKYFEEEAPEYHVLCAGSLLGIHLHSGSDGDDSGLPVGKVHIIDMYPMNFEEFLLADGCGKILEASRGLSVDEDVPDYLATRLVEELERYYVVGGMPDAVRTWVGTKDITAVRDVQRDILRMYSEDLGKHPVDRRGTLDAVWKSIPLQLAKNSARFRFGQATHAPRENLEAAVTWLSNAGLIHVVNLIEGPSVPLSMYDTGFYKIYMADIGLFRLLSGAPTSFVNSAPEEYKDFKGAMAENMILQQIMVGLDEVPRSWTSGATAEVDFVAMIMGEPVPIEVKSGTARSSKSLKVYRERYSPRVAVKVSNDDKISTGHVVHIPLYMVWRIEDYIRGSLEKTGWKDPNGVFSESVRDRFAHFLAKTRYPVCPSVSNDGLTPPGCTSR